MQAYLRNKQTGEIRDVITDTPEFSALKAQSGPDGRSLWEQTGDHHVGALAARVEAEALREEDLGEAMQPIAPIVVDTNAVGPAHAPWLEPTAAEREMGLTREDKVAAIEDDTERAAAQERESTWAEARSAIGGTVPSGFPVDTADADDAEEDVDDTESRYDGMSKADLQEEAESRDLSKSGTVAELKARLEADDADNLVNGGSEPTDEPA